MPSITLKDIPGSVHAALKKRAVEHGRSLNKEVIACLEASVLVKPVDREALLADFRIHRDSLPGKLDDALLETARKTGRP
jgi:plasmid stability protein